MITKIFGFLGIMWALMLVGGGIVVTVLGPITISGYGSYDAPIGSALKAGVALVLVVGWVVILSKMKDWIFKKELRS